MAMLKEAHQEQESFLESLVFPAGVPSEVRQLVIDHPRVISLLISREEAPNISWEERCRLAADKLVGSDVVRELVSKPGTDGVRYVPRQRVDTNLHDFEPGQPRYIRLAQQLGSGGMADVFVGIDPVMEREVAIKEIHVQQAKRDPQLLGAMAAEARLAANLPSYLVPQLQNIDREASGKQVAKSVASSLAPRIFDIGVEGQGDQERLSIVMERLPEKYQTLEQVKKKFTKLLEEKDYYTPEAFKQEKAKILRSFIRTWVDLATFIDESAAEDIYHRDLKPANIFALLDGDNPENGSVKVLDFGFATPVFDHEAYERTGFWAGTPLYLSPERAVSMVKYLDRQEQLLDKETERMLEEAYPTPESMVEKKYSLVAKFLLGENRQQLERIRRQLSSASEIFTFASIIYEMITGRARWAYRTPLSIGPTDHVSDEDKINTVIADLTKAVPLLWHEREFLVQRADELGLEGERVASVLELCWIKDPQERLEYIVTASNLVATMLSKNPAS